MADYPSSQERYKRIMEVEKQKKELAAARPLPAGTYFTVNTLGYQEPPQGTVYRTAERIVDPKNHSRVLLGEGVELNAQKARALFLNKVDKIKVREEKKG